MRTDSTVVRTGEDAGETVTNSEVATESAPVAKTTTTTSEKETRAACDGGIGLLAVLPLLALAVAFGLKDLEEVEIAGLGKLKTRVAHVEKKAEKTDETTKEQAKELADLAIAIEQRNTQIARLETRVESNLSNTVSPVFVFASDEQRGRTLIEAATRPHASRSDLIERGARLISQLDRLVPSARSSEAGSDLWIAWHATYGESAAAARAVLGRFTASAELDDVAHLAAAVAAIEAAVAAASSMSALAAASDPAFDLATLMGEDDSTTEDTP